MIINNTSARRTTVPQELDHSVAVITPDAAISALLCLFHYYATQEQSQPSPRLSQRIYRHLEGLSQRDDLPEILHKTCDELCDAWQLMLDRQQARLT
jgi:hypothetical protein